MPAWCACHVVSPTGAGAKTGADWNNAFDKALLSTGTAFVRGDTYYLATGSYDTFILNVADSGTSVITILGAIASDHCTATGWSAGLGVENAPAVFNPTGLTAYGTGIMVNIRSNYVTIDGNYRAAARGPFGFKINNLAPNGVKTPFFGAGYAGAQHDQTIRNLEVQGLGQYESHGEWRGVATTGGAVCNGAGNTVTLTMTKADGTTALASRWVTGQYIVTATITLAGFTNGQYQVASTPTSNTMTIAAACTASQSGGTGYLTGPLNDNESLMNWSNAADSTKGNITVDHVWLHDSADQMLQFDRMTGVTLSNSVLERDSECWPNDTNCANTGQIGVHGNVMTFLGMTNLTLSNNIFADAEGTAYIDNTGGMNESNIVVTGNVFFVTPANPYKLQTGVAGILYKTSGGGNMDSLKFWNNTIWNVNSIASGGSNSGVYTGGSGSTITNSTIKNNLWVNSTLPVTLAEGTGDVHDYNSLLGATFSGTTPGSNESQVNTCTTDPFVSSAGLNFHLSSELSNANCGTFSLVGTPTSPPSGASPDVDGIVRAADGTWDRGAFEFSLSGTINSAPALGMFGMP